MKSGSLGEQRGTEPPAQTVVRTATALLMTFAAALVLVHAQVYAAGSARLGTIASSASTAGPR